MDHIPAGTGLPDIDAGLVDVDGICTDQLAEVGLELFFKGPSVDGDAQACD